MEVITDQIKVFSLLELHDQADFNPAESCTRIFKANDNTAILLFCHEGPNKGAVLYLLSSPAVPMEIEQELLPSVLMIDGDHTMLAVRDEALDKIRIMIEEKNRASSFFDAH